MGYRSQVRSLIYGPKEKLDEFLLLHTTILGSEVFRYFKDSLSRYTVKADIYLKEQKSSEEILIHVLDLSGYSWKWYESYEDVQAWENLIYEAQEFGLNTEFIRIGEDDTDIVCRTNDDNLGLLGISRSICDDFTKESDVELNI